MLLPLISALVALGCAAASARRLWFASTATTLHPDDVIAALGSVPDGASLDRLRDVVDEEPSAEWERDLFAALSVRDVERRAALVNEQLSELDYRVQRWARVPRVCASLAASSGLLLATLVLRRGLSELAAVDGDVTELLVMGLIGEALTVAALGIVGTTFCVAAHAQARKLARERLAAADRMVERLEAAAASFAEARGPRLEA